MFTFGQISLLRICCCTCTQFEEAIRLKLRSNPLHDRQGASEQFRVSTGGCNDGSGVRGGGGGNGVAVTGPGGSGQIEMYGWEWSGG